MKAGEGAAQADEDAQAEDQYAAAAHHERRQFGKADDFGGAFLPDPRIVLE